MIRRLVDYIRNLMDDMNQEEKVAGVFVFLLFSLIFGIMMFAEGSRNIANTIHLTYPITNQLKGVINV